MKDLSFFLLNNTLGAKIMKSFKSFCNGDSSTSTLNQHKTTHSPFLSPYVENAEEENPPPPSATTLEEMILQLEIEEKMARKCRAEEYYGVGGGGGGVQRRRMSCVNNSDILRSARNALNQYPRFSLDGKDAMYRSSFRNFPAAGGSRKSFCCNGEPEMGKKRRCFPATLGGERVVWCKPGVVAKLMGLEAMPVPVSGFCGRGSLGDVMKRQSVKKKAERHDEIDQTMDQRRRRLVININGGGDGTRRGVNVMGSCSTKKYCVMKPVVPLQPENDHGVGCPIPHFL